MDFSRRNTETEWMDDPGLEKSALVDVFKDISRSNSFLGGVRITMKELAGILKDHPKKKLTILDVGCGDGYLLRTIARQYRQEGIAHDLVGIDLSEAALSLATEQSKDYPEIRYLQRDVLSLQEEGISCDVIICTLTMHHFSNEQIPDFLKAFAKMAAKGIVINDLQRSRMAFYLFKAFSAIFIRTHIAKHDGLISIRSGFTRKELQEFSKMVPGATHRINWRWAFRYVWVMRTDSIT